ncbi:MAG: hypothetical protein WKF84_02225 [Pyrinomonadaceae bacterium]
MADPRVMNEIIWYSVRGSRSPMPEIARLPIFEAMRAGVAEDDDEEEREESKSVSGATWMQMINCEKEVERIEVRG